MEENDCENTGRSQRGTQRAILNYEPTLIG